MKAGQPGTPSKDDWLLSVLKEGDRVGVDATVIANEAASKMSNVLMKKKIKLELMDENLVDTIWTERPKESLNQVELLPTKFAGVESQEKLAKLREQLRANDQPLYGMLVTSLDEIACKHNTIH